MIFRNYNETALSEATAVVSNSRFLRESESVFYPEMIPVVESVVYNTNVMRLEDLCEYATSNGITDAGKAITSICECNDIDTNVSFSVDEVNMLMDDELAETAKAFVENGYQVFRVPIANTDPAFCLAEAVTENMVYLESKGAKDTANKLLEAYVADDFQSLLEFDVLGKAKEIGVNMKSRAEKVANRVTSALKSGFVNSKEWVVKKIASLRKMKDYYAKKLKSKAHSIADNPTINSIIGKIQSAIDWLKQKAGIGRKKK